MKLILTLSVFLLVSTLYSQDYDYVLPDSTPDVQKRSALTLPIKPKDPQPTYFVPSYVSDRESGDITKNTENEEEKPDDQSKTNRVSVNLEVGTSVSSDFNGNSAIRTYAAPHIRYQVDDRLAISGGVVMSQTFFNGWKNYSFEGGPMPSTLYSNTVYGRIDYRVNERMLVYGAVYSNLASIPGATGYNLQGTGYTVGMQYKVSEKSFIQVQVSRSSGYNPFNPYNRYSPYSNSFGFGHQPFSYFP